MQEEIAIPPIEAIKKVLSDFEMKVPVWGLTIFTVDGYILALIVMLPARRFLTDPFVC